MPKVEKNTLESQQKVVVAVVQSDDKFLLVRRKEAKGNLVWNFPGGKIEIGETELAAAEREVLEETGVQCEAIRTMGQRRHPNTGRMVTYVLCGYTTGDAHITEPDKSTQVRWLKPESVIARITSNIYEPVKDLLQTVSQRDGQRLSSPSL
jgi:8-oxo-dGTP diphosphatase